MESLSQQLSRCALFAQIEPANVEKMAECMNIYGRQFAKGEYVLMADAPAVNIGMVLRGSVRIVSEDYWGNRTILTQVEAGGIFGEAFTCTDMPRLPVSVVAAERCKVAFVDYRTMTTTCQNACSFHIRMIQNMLRQLADKNLSLTEKLSHLAKRTTREKLLSYLSEQANLAGSSCFTIPFNRQELADYLCVDRSAMSTELSKLKAEGLLDCERNRFQLR